MVDLSKVNKSAIQIMMKTTGMWGLRIFEELEDALSGWHSSETAGRVKNCINSLLRNQQKDLKEESILQMAIEFVENAIKMLRSNDEIIDVLRKVFTAIAAKEGKVTYMIGRTKKYLDETKEHPSKILEMLVSLFQRLVSMFMRNCVYGRLVLFMVIKIKHLYITARTCKVTR